MSRTSSDCGPPRLSDSFGKTKKFFIKQLCSCSDKTKRLSRVTIFNFQTRLQRFIYWVVWLSWKLIGPIQPLVLTNSFTKKQQCLLAIHSHYIPSTVVKTESFSSTFFISSITHPPPLSDLHRQPSVASVTNNRLLWLESNFIIGTPTNKPAFQKVGQGKTVCYALPFWNYIVVKVNGDHAQIMGSWELQVRIVGRGNEKWAVLVLGNGLERII